MATKKARSSAKAVVTRKINEIIALMTDEGNVEEVNKKSGELLEAFDKFQAIHEAFHKELIDAESVRESEKYYQSVFGQVDLLLENLEIWLTGIEATRAMSSIEVRSEDSVSNVSCCLRMSHSSQVSKTLRSSHTSSVSTRAKAEARKAAPEAEAATLKMLHEIEEEELKLHQHKNELKLKTELAKARAEEHAYAQVEIGANSPHASDQKRNLPPTPQLTEENLKDKVEGQNEPKEEKPEPASVEKLPIQTKTLNPKALEWKKEDTRFPIMGNEATRSTPTADLQLLLQQQEAIMALTLPQPELPVFTGDPIEYCDFIRAFENLVERKTSSSSARLYYLLQYTSGHVQDLVRSCLAMREDVGYSEARRLLAERYGQPFKIATAYVDRVINGQPIRAEDGPALQRFSILLTSCTNTFNEIGYSNRLENPESLRKIVDRLPYPLRLKWRDVVDTIAQKEERDPNLHDITNFVEAKSRVTNHPIFGKVQGDQKPFNQKSNWKQKRDAKSLAAQGQGQSQQQKQLSNSEERKELKCPSCKKDHWLSQCDEFKKLSLYNRYQFVRSKHLCINCLVPGHFVQDCPKRSFCRVEGCAKKHSTFLHEKQSPPKPSSIDKENPTSNQGQVTSPSKTQAKNGYVKSESFQVSSDSVVGMSIVPVKVSVKGQDKKVLTYAFLDSGSNTSFCTEDLLKKLNAKGERATLSLTTMGKSNETIECSFVNLEVSDIGNQNLIELPMVYSRPSLPVSTAAIGTQEDVNRWPHLKGIDVPRIEAAIGLLIGSDVPQAMQPKEVRESKNEGPFAMRTVLG